MSEDREIYFVQAMQEGLREAMAEDETVVVIGEDVDRSVIGATKGLIEEFGPMRVRNTPISEATFVGACVGAAASGLKPVADLMIGSFFYVAMDQVANQAAKLPYMSGGQIQLPMVLFAASGPSAMSRRASEFACTTPRIRSVLSSSVTTSRVCPELTHRRRAVSTFSERSTVTTAGAGVMTCRACCSCRWKTPVSMPASPGSSLPPVSGTETNRSTMADASSMTA